MYATKYQPYRIPIYGQYARYANQQDHIYYGLHCSNPISRDKLLYKTQSSNGLIDARLKNYLADSWMGLPIASRWYGAGPVFQ